MASVDTGTVKYVKSLVELVLATYAFTFLGLILASGFDLTNIGAVKAAAVASVPSALSVVYGVLSRLVGNFNSALAVDTRDGR